MGAIEELKTADAVVSQVLLCLAMLNILLHDNLETLSNRKKFKPELPAC